jgi:polar amino acid transport system substrate-binding protein
MGQLNQVRRVLGCVALVAALSGGASLQAREGHAARATARTALRGLLKNGVLQWGADDTGGAPYVFPDPKHPSTLIGFEVDIANEFARRLHVKQQMVQTSWDNLPAAILHKRFDMIMNGLEITPDRQKVLLFSRPYYVYTEQVVVQKGNTTIHGFNDLPGKTVGTGTGYKSDDIMQAWNKAHPDKKINIKEYDTDLPFADLDAGRLDAVFIDLPIAAYYALPPIDDKLKLAGPPVDPGYYGIAFTPNNTALASAINGAIAAMARDGTLGRIYRKWNLMNTAQAKIGIH